MKKEWGEGKATFQTGVTAHGEGKLLLEEQGTQELRDSQDGGGKKSALRGVWK